MWSTRGYFEKIFGDIWENLVKQGRHTLYSCRLITLLASLRDGGELNNSALDAIDKWIVSTSDDHREKVRACAFRAFANYTFGYFSEAVHDSEIALQRAEEEKDNNLAAGVKMNLAYFIAEEFYQNPSGHSRETDYARVKTLLSDAESVFTGNPRAFEDTRGAIKIAFGENEEQIRDGLSLCCAARSKVELGTHERPAADAFYRLHEHRACHRLLQWE